jgi:DNA repair ATPase RecN
MFKKQIFVVTHNPSIVVYGDAENIVLAKNEKNKISYTQTVIENPESQKKICKILDGGDYIFDIRSRKYNINRLKKESHE